MKYLVAIDNHISSAMVGDVGYYAVSSINDCKKVVKEYCKAFDMRGKDVDVDFNNKTISFSADYFDDDDETTWTIVTLYLIEIQNAKEL